MVLFLNSTANVHRLIVSQRVHFLFRSGISLIKKEKNEYNQHKKLFAIFE